MPFPDELARGLAVAAYDRRWSGDFAVLARRIQGALGPAAVQVSRVGSTSVPGLAAKDCIDVQVEVLDIAMASDIYQYGQAKAGPTQILMIAAESWALQTQWAPPPAMTPA